MIKIDNKKSWILFIIILIFFIIIIKERITYSLSDENAYFYMTRLISDGQLPYRDFFFAHPPLQLFILFPIIKLFGFNIIILKLVPVLAIILSSFFLFKIMKYKFNNLTALLGVILFLFEYNILRISTQAVGINLTLLFILIGFYYFIKNKNIISGFFFGLAGITGLYSLIPISVIFIYSLIKNRKNFLKLLTGFSIFFIINLLFLIISSNFINQVYLYHFMKPENVHSLYRFLILFVLIEKNLILFLSLILSLIFYKKFKNIKYIKLILIITLVYIIFLLILKKPFIFYYILLFPFLAIVGSLAINELLKKINRKKISAIILSLIIIFTISYALINFYKDTEKTNMKKINELADFIKENSEKTDLIFGDYYIVPLLALITDRKIALNEVDTNLMTFQSVKDINKLIYRLENEKRLKYIIIEANRDFAYSKEFVEFTENCKLIKIDKAENFGEYYIFDC